MYWPSAEYCTRIGCSSGYSGVARFAFKSHRKTSDFSELAEIKTSLHKGLAVAAVTDSPLAVSAFGFAFGHPPGSPTYQYWLLLLNRKYLPSPVQIPQQACWPLFQSLSSGRNLRSAPSSQSVIFIDSGLSRLKRTRCPSGDQRSQNAWPGVSASFAGLLPCRSVK